MAITYNAGTDTITVTAGTAGTPNTFTDIYNADVAGSWGQVTKTGNMFVFSAKLQIGDGSTATYLHDTFKKVTLNEIWTVKNNAELKTGLQISSKPRKGCFLVLNTSAATAINVESGGKFYQYQTPTEDTGTGTNLISGATEDFYRGVQIVDIKGGYSDQFWSIGLAEDKTKARVVESVSTWLLYILMYNPLIPGWVAVSNIEPGVGYYGGASSDCCLIVDNIVDGEYYDVIFTGYYTKHRFDVPTGGGGIMRNPPLTGGTV